MTEETDKKNIVVRRILVAVDTSSHSNAALKAAASLAKTLKAEIKGMFVEEEEWGQATRISSTRSINELTGDLHPLENKTLEHQLATLRNRLRRKLKYFSGLNQVEHSWHAARGNVEEEIMEAAEEADLITIGYKGKSVRRKRLGSTAKFIIQQSGKPVLILKEGLNLGSTIKVVFNGTEESLAGIRFALDIAHKNSSTLSILVTEGDAEHQSDVSRRFGEMMKRTPVLVEIEELKQQGISSLLNAINKQNPGLLIVPKNQPVLARSLETCLNHIHCPVLLIG